MQYVMAVTIEVTVDEKQYAEAVGIRRYVAAVDAQEIADDLYHRTVNRGRHIFPDLIQDALPKARVTEVTVKED